MITVPSKDPQNKEPYFFVWCDADGLNDGSINDHGELQGATISSYVVTVPSGITKDSDAKTAVTIHGVVYGVNTVVTVWLSGGTDNTNYDILCHVVLSDLRELDMTMRVPVRAH